MNSQPWLDAWKSAKERRREALKTYLSRKPVNPAVAAMKARYMKRLETATGNRTAFAHAYQQHLQEVKKLLSGSSSTVSSTAPSPGPGPKGSLGET